MHGAAYYESEDELQGDLHALGGSARRVTVGLSNETWDGPELPALDDEARRRLGPIAVAVVRNGVSSGGTWS